MQSVLVFLRPKKLTKNAIPTANRLKLRLIFFFLQVYRPGFE